MNKHEKFVEDLVTDYKADRITWHDIQDQVQAYVMQLDGEGMTTNWETMRVRWTRADILLNDIERRIK